MCISGDPVPVYVNLDMIKKGYAWYYPFDGENPEYKQAEQEAKEAKLGLWADKNPIAPWEWRKQNTTRFQQRYN